MFEDFNFELLRLRYIKAAMDAILSFRPDDKTPAQVGAMILSAEGPGNPRSNYQTAEATLQLARGEYEEDILQAHELCVQVYPIMKSRFRMDPGSLSAINSLPTSDQTGAATLTRIKATSTLWAQLPNPPGSVNPFRAWDTMDRAAFDAYITAIEGTVGPPPIVGTLAAKAAAESAFQVAEGAIHTFVTGLADFTTNALVQGRAQYPEGTANREVIDAIPTAPASQPPGQAVITNAASPSAGEAEFDYTALHGTSFDIYRQGPGQPAFVKVASDVIVKHYRATGLPAGAYDFKVIAHNSRGDGPASAVSVINVA
ncbi:MAG: hypothetical protein RL514_3978 [Verrucomicrobiota bacterium]|jgi:hypothetical protein